MIDLALLCILFAMIMLMIFAIEMTFDDCKLNGHNFRLWIYRMRCRAIVAYNTALVLKYDIQLQLINRRLRMLRENEVKENDRFR